MPGVTCYRQNNADIIFPFHNVDNTDLHNVFNEYNVIDSCCKCGECKKKIRKNMPAAHCFDCHKYFHLKCARHYDKHAPLDWACSACTIKSLPFSKVNDEIMKLAIHGFDDETIEFINEKSPSFTIQSLLDKIPGQKFDTDQFLGNSINSKYYAISDFVSAKFSNNKFSVFHLNIASLQKHIDELRTLLSCIQHSFDIICISETRIQNEMPLANIEIDGYEFIHTPTLTQCGGTQCT